MKIANPTHRWLPALILISAQSIASLSSLKAWSAPAFEDSESNAKSEIQFRMEPHFYFGDRGTEPKFQAVGQTSLRFRSGAPKEQSSSQWVLQLHAESELMGRRDQSFDLDRAWISVKSGPGEVTLGRIHPWDLSGNLEAARPWGYAQQYQPQNRGILLGQGFLGSNDEVFPQPILLGWVGVHFWSDHSRKEKTQWGLSATPFFVPNLGSEVTFSDSVDASAGRFGRRPPGNIDVSGTLLPLRYKIDSSRIFQDVILNPQVAIQLRREYLPTLVGHYSLQYIPSPDADPDTSGFVSVSGSGVNAVAEVRPKFPKSLVATLTHIYRPSGFFERTKFFLTTVGNTDGRMGFELGLSYKSMTLSYFAQRTPTSGSASQNAVTSYADQLLQFDSAIAIDSKWNLFAGFKLDPAQKDSWIRAVSKHQLSPRAQFEWGGETFAGSDGSYFSEWRTNDRVYCAFTWRLET